MHTPAPDDPVGRLGRAVAKRLVAGFSPRRPGFEFGSGHEGFVMEKTTLG
jgi:hypothetical protein